MAYRSSIHSDELYRQHQRLMRERIGQLPHPPSQRLDIERQFEDLLRAIHFFERPDIIPHPEHQACYTEIDELRRRNRELEAELAARSSHTELQYLQDEHQALLRRNRELEATNARLAQQFRDLEAVHEELKNRHTQQGKKQEAANEESDALKARMDAIESQLARQSQSMRTSTSTPKRQKGMTRRSSKRLTTVSSRLEELSKPSKGYCDTCVNVHKHGWACHH